MLTDLLSTLPLQPAQLLAALAIMTLGATVQSSAGFGLGLVAAPVLLLIDPMLIPAPLLICGVTLALMLSIRDRKGLNIQGIQIALVGQLLGIIPAILILSAISPKVFDLVFAAVLLAAVAVSLLGLSLKPTPERVFVAGALSGLMATISSVGGPPMALIYQGSKGLELRGTLSGYFTLSGSFSLVALAFAGRCGLQEMQLALLLLPGLIFGLILSAPLAERLEQVETRPIVLGLSFCSAIAVLIKAIYT
ncbi:hypothetical protein C1752_01458 [Acaryochloris thomasi RCC1774]|uniref:Probable membrane transporter protein n=1 Tax=Acaryochloris thomasi RCC1774 TaxID=1764569 RepID=A0A2W1JUX8_9CYAN|nr:sulfite exporter TauE/SafE family protein [Acaryochloris thomasi]PZD74282.1 hypothetical protein C1752_01458 [Acaryochloris thomasi RCC1774]